MKKKDSTLSNRHRRALHPVARHRTTSHLRSDMPSIARNVRHSSSDPLAHLVHYPLFSDYELIQTRTLTHDGVKILTPIPRGFLNNASVGTTTYLSRELALEMRLLALRAGRA